MINLIPPEKVQQWINNCAGILFVSIFVFFVSVRREVEKGHIHFLILAMNFAISVMMGIAFSYLTDVGFYHIYKEPTPDYLVVIGGGLGALLSYSGFEFLLDRIETLFDRIIDIFIKRYEK